MIVSELITFLEKKDPNAIIVISAPEGGGNECQTAISIKLLPIEDKDWHPGLGTYDVIFKGYKKFTENPNEIEGVLLQ